MFDTLKKVLSLLAIDERKKLYWLIVAIILMAIFDMLGIASIFPFLSVMSDPNVIQTNAKLKMIYDHFGFTSKNGFLIALGVASFVLLVVGNIIRAVVNIALMRFTWLKRHTISSRLLAQYLYEPYAFFLNRNSAELIGYLMSEVAKVVNDVLIPCMQIFARSILAILVMGLLFFVDFVVATVVMAVIGGGYALVYVFVKKQLSLSGEDSVIYNQKVFKILSEVFGGIKDVKLLGKERVFINQYDAAVKKLVDSYTDRFLISQLPRNAFEVITFGGILFIVTYLIIVKGEYQQVIPVVGLYAFAALRLMPTLQLIFQDVTSLKFGLPALDRIHHDYFNCVADDQKETGPIQALPFKRNIRFSNVNFTYPKAKNPVIKDFNLDIKVNTTIGFVGGTGAGKTTIVDILLGLLRPQEGKILIDDTNLSDENLRHWQKNIGYVPQHIYLSDDTIMRNIAFGVPDEQIDKEAVIAAAKLANIHKFITTELPNGYETKVGERGVRLSGGQRQRIGIARALYYNPSVFVFDEATSALDGITEDIILEAVYNLAHKKTMIIIAHRFTTVKECDKIYVFEQGKVVDEGTYQELLERNQEFRKMARLTETKTP